MVLDGPLLRQARSEAFTLIDNDKDLTNESNERLKKWFIGDYSQYLDNIRLS